MLNYIRASSSAVLSNTLQFSKTMSAFRFRVELGVGDLVLDGVLEQELPPREGGGGGAGGWRRERLEGRRSGELREGDIGRPVRVEAVVVRRCQRRLLRRHRRHREHLICAANADGLGILKVEIQVERE